MIDKELLEILACPETHQPLREARKEEVEALNRKLASGGVKNVADKAVTIAIEAALIREDGKRAYPIVDGIPVLLVDEGIPL